MIQISKQEADRLRRIDPTIYITITGTGKKSRNKRRYVEEDMRALRLLPDNAEAAAIVSAYDKRMEARSYV